MEKKRTQVFLDFFNANRKRNGNALSNDVERGGGRKGVRREIEVKGAHETTHGRTRLPTGSTPML